MNQGRPPRPKLALKKPEPGQSTDAGKSTRTPVRQSVFNKPSRAALTSTLPVSGNAPAVAKVNPAQKATPSTPAPDTRSTRSTRISPYKQNKPTATEQDIPSNRIPTPYARDVKTPPGPLKSRVTPATRVADAKAPLPNSPYSPYSGGKSVDKSANNPTPSETNPASPYAKFTTRPNYAKPEPQQLRLSKRMSELGLCSRREADEWIERGWVRVDGQIVSELGSKVWPGQKITVERQAAAEQSKRVTIIINKPVGYVSGQAEDGYKPAVVLVTAENRWQDDPVNEVFHPKQTRSLVPAGRLDIDSVGLLVLTQDGRVAKQLIGEDTVTEKEYLVRVSYTKRGKLPDTDLALLRHGLALDGKALLPALVEWQNEDQLRFVLKEGKKRQIRRMCEAVGLKVLGLKRVRIGNVLLGDLPTGQWRYLRPDEYF